MHTEVEANWVPGPMSPRLQPATVDVWRMRPVDRGGDGREQARVAMRAILGSYLNIEPDALALARMPGGKPRLADPHARLRFNLSHTRGLAILALSGDYEVGADLETLDKPLVDPLRIARRVMDASSLRQLEALTDPAGRLALFIDLWTRLEARQKAYGRGIFETDVGNNAAFTYGFSADAGFTGCVAVRTAMAATTAATRLRFFAHAPA